MNAEYKAVCIGRNEYFKADHDTYTHNYSSPNELDGHAFIGNSYVDMVMLNIKEGSWKNQSIAWSCILDENSLWENEDLKNISFSSKHNNTVENSKTLYSRIIILNNSKKEYIDLSEYSANQTNRDFILVHPFPLLTSVSKIPMGVGDYQIPNDYRGRWSGDKFSIISSKFQIPLDYDNISNISFPCSDEEETYNENKFIKKALQSKKIDEYSNPSISLACIYNGASKKDLIDLLKNSQGALVSYYDENMMKKIITIELDKDNLTQNESSKYFYYSRAFTNRDSKKIDRFEFSKLIEATAQDEYDMIPF
jgi:hypothetical protein